MYSDYIVYVDESGDHDLVSIDPQYPIFALAFCVFHKEHYRTVASPALQALKFKHFGHDMVILHEREIRKSEGEYSSLLNSKVRNVFIEDLAALIDRIDFTIISIGIEKRRLGSRYAYPSNPYDLALQFGLEGLQVFLKSKGAPPDQTTHVILEQRGRREDRMLDEAFADVCEGTNYNQQRFPFDRRFADRRANSCGLQLADLVARPIGRHALDPGQSNRAWEGLKSMLFRRGGRVKGLGLKIFPDP